MGFLVGGRWGCCIVIICSVISSFTSTYLNIASAYPFKEGCIIKRSYDPDEHKPVYTVGVLAFRGVETAYKDFNSTFSDYLSATAGKRFDPPIRFEMKPLNFRSVFTDSEAGLIDFLYVQPSLMSCIESEYGAQSLVSQISRRNVGGNVYNLNKFGGVIAARYDNNKIQSIQDLKGKIVAAASISGFGSGQMQFREMIDAGMSYINDPKQIVFTANQNKIVNGVLNGEFDVGFVRTDQIERTKDGDGNLVNASMFKIIDPKPNLHIDRLQFPFQSSTQLYPEWNIAALTHVPWDVSLELQKAMLEVGDHAKFGFALQACRDNFNKSSYCNNLAFPHDFAPFLSPHDLARFAKCETPIEVADFAREAVIAGKYSGWRPTLSYMQLRSMQESIGFISHDKESNTWRCVRVKELYDAVTCPEGFIKKSKEDIDSGCTKAGLTCKEGYKCICSPCFQPLVCVGNTVQVFNTCMSVGLLFAAVVIPVCLVIALVAHVYVRRKKRQADCVWRVEPEELKFDNPPVVIGEGAFGRVLLAEYRGTNVAVKRVIPPRSNIPVSKQQSWQKSLYCKNVGHDMSYSNDLSASMSAGVDVQCKTEAGILLGTEELGDGSSHLEATYEPSLSSGTTTVQDKFLREGKMAKLITMKDGDFSRLKMDFIKEMRHLSRLRHPCITTVMGAVISKRFEPMLVMEFMSHGSLYDLLHNESIIVQGEIVLPILRDIAQGMRFLHSANPQVIHGDLKAQNILVDARFHAKVADFGLSQKRRMGIAGTTYWMAPELLRGESLNTAASDIYSFGIVLYEVYSRKDPYEGEEHNEVLRQVCHRQINKRPPVPKTCPPKMIELMSDCLAADPADRTTAADIDLLLKLLDVSTVEPRRNSYHKQKPHFIHGQNKQILYDMFPKHIADTLAAGKKVEPESHELVTIFFSDIVGFTNISASFSPMKVSEMLDRLYSAFDRLATKYGVFKIETAGDAYMGVTNLVQDQSTDHVKRITEFAIDAINVASKILVDVDDPEKGFINIRVGIHSGPVVSNIVGSLNPKYGIFGDSVNIASRMESSSTVGKVQCSSRTAMLLTEQAPEILISLRGEVSIKGKGDMTTYWINGKEQHDDKVT